MLLVNGRWIALNALPDAASAYSKSVRSQIMSSSSASLAPCSFLMASITLHRQTKNT